MAGLIKIESYLDTLTDMQLAALEVALDEYTYLAYHFKDATEDEEIVARVVDNIIAEAPPLTAPVTIYKRFADAPEMRGGAKLVEPTYYVGTTNKNIATGGDDAVTVALKLPVGTKALSIKDGVYALQRGLTIDLAPTPSGPIPATIGNSSKGAATEFHLIGQHDQSSHGSGGGGGSTRNKGRNIGAARSAGPGGEAAKKSSASIARKRSRVAKIQKVTRIIIAASMIAFAGYLILTSINDGRSSGGRGGGPRNKDSEWYRTGPGRPSAVDIGGTFKPSKRSDQRRQNESIRKRSWWEQEETRRHRDDAHANTRRLRQEHPQMFKPNGPLK